jgi:large subunit ribosomal protein L6
MAEKKDSKSKEKKGITVEIQMPEGIDASVDGRMVRVKGPNGELVKILQSNIVQARYDGRTIVLTVPHDRKKERALINTQRGEVLNMIHGVRDGVTYRLKVLFSHFPMGLKVQGESLLIDNFLGEKHPRRAAILDGVKVDVKGQDVTVTGIDKDNTAQTAANIEQATKIKKLDPRVFQDGIYIVEKDGKPLR